MLQTVAVLYCDPCGTYSEAEGVELWDEARDARTYRGPHPVVAHPPCNRWSVLALCRPEIPMGEDGGCFAAALDAVETFGGVLEHPAHSRAWDAFDLVEPLTSGWHPSFTRPGWTCEVDQGHYGHRCRKLTWLYYVGPDPPPMIWGDGGMRDVEVHNDGGGGSDRRSATPSAFRDVLLAMARGVTAG